MPTAFVPSPNKNTVGLSFSSAHFSPLKVTNFTQGQQQASQLSARGGGMHLKAASVCEVPRESADSNSARSGGSNDAKTEGGLTPSLAAQANPFKQTLNMHKHKSMAVAGGSFSGRASNTTPGVGLPSNTNLLGFKVPDSSSPFAFQPMNGSITFGGPG